MLDRSHCSDYGNFRGDDLCESCSDRKPCRVKTELTPVSLFPYSEDDPRPKMCKWSGSGYIHCTESIRKRKAKICDTCPENPTLKKSKTLQARKRAGD